MGSSIVATGNNVKFIGGVTPLTQANWQEYFGTLEPNGIVSGFDFLDRGLSLDTKITDGKIYMNGILYSLDTNDGYTTIAQPTQEEVDTFVCARVYFHEERIELIRKTNIAPATYYAQYIPYVEQFATDESYQCDRNSSFYELPIGYRVYRREIGDLRRFRADDSEIIVSNNLQPVPVQSNRTYVIRGDSSNIRIYVDIVKTAKQVKIVTDMKSEPIYFYDVPYIDTWTTPNSDFRNYSDLRMTFVRPSSFTYNSTNHAYVYTTSNNSGPKTITLTRLSAYEYTISVLDE